MKDELEFNLPEEVTVFNVQYIKQELQDTIKDLKLLKINCSKLKMIDLAGLQLLIALKKSTLNNGSAIQIVEPNTVFREAIKLAGIQEFLEV